jgi:type I restriction enzyme S subunit
MIRKHEKYSSSGLDWIEGVPFHWGLGKLKYNASIAISTVDRHESDDEIKVSVCHYPQAYNNEKVNVQTILSSGTCNEKQLENFSLRKGQIIITKDSETSDDIGVPTLVEEDIPNAVCGYHLAIITTDKDKVNPSFLFRYLQSKNVNYYFDSKSNGVTRFGLGKPAMENLPILIPPITEQNKIAEYLDHKTVIIDRLVQKKVKLIELLKEKRQAIINEIVTRGLNPTARMKNSGILWLGEVPDSWVVVKLKHLVEMKSGNFISSEMIEDEGFYPVYGGNGKRGFYSEFTHDGFYPLIGRQGALCGNINYADGKFWPTEHAVVVSSKKDVNMYWVGELLRLMNLNQYSQASAQPGLSVEKIMNLRVPFPPFEEQNQIASMLGILNEKFELSNAQLLNSVERLKEYRQSIISEAVTGKIDVRDWQPNKRILV